MLSQNTFKYNQNTLKQYPKELAIINIFKISRNFYKTCQLSNDLKNIPESVHPTQEYRYNSQKIKQSKSGSKFRIKITQKHNTSFKELKNHKSHFIQNIPTFKRSIHLASSLRKKEVFQTNSNNSNGPINITIKFYQYID